MVILREEIKSLQTVKASLQLRINELEDDLKKARDELNNRLKKQEEDDVSIPTTRCYFAKLTYGWSFFYLLYNSIISLIDTRFDHTLHVPNVAEVEAHWRGAAQLEIILSVVQRATVDRHWYAFWSLVSGR